MKPELPPTAARASLAADMARQHRLPHLHAMPHVLADGVPGVASGAAARVSVAHTIDRADAPPSSSSSNTQPGTTVQTRRMAGRAVQVQIVEDLPRVQQLLRQLVEQPGRFDVTGIDDTEHEAFQRSQAQPPDALVVDLNLRQGSGLGLIHAVRKLYGASPTGPLIIVVTNHTMPVLEAACLKAGADHFLDKSRELPRLAALLQQAFSF